MEVFNNGGVLRVHSGKNWKEVSKRKIRCWNKGSISVLDDIIREDP